MGLIVSRFVRMILVVVGVASAGCAPQRRPPVAPEAPPPQAEPEVVELPTLVTTRSGDVVEFLESTTAPTGIPESAKADLAVARPSAAGRVDAIRVRTGTFACFVRRTASDDRAAVLRTSAQGFLVVPTSWLAAVVMLPGAKADDVHAFYVAMQRELAQRGRATGLARFANGNAVEVTLSLRDLGETDAELVAERRFLRAGDYDPTRARITVEAVDGVRTIAKNRHRGVSIHDLLRDLPVASETKATTT